MSVQWLRRIAREERGSFLVEIMVSALLLIMLTGGAIAAFDVAAKQSGHQRFQAVAANAAQSELERLRSLKFANVVPATLNALPATTKPIGGTQYTITSRSESALNPQAAGAGCDDAARSPEALRLTVTVTWPQMNGRAPVTVSSIVSAPVGGDASRGSFSVQIVNQEGYGVEGIAVKMAGPSTVTGTTDSNGCARFTDMLPDNAYHLTFQRANWFTSPAPQRNAVDDIVSIVAGQTGTKSYQYDEGGPLKASFYFKRGAGASDPEYDSFQKAVTFESSTFSSPKVQYASTPAGAVANTIATTEGYPNLASPYGAYADTCVSARPPTPTTLNPPGAARIQLPALDLRASNVAATAKVYVLSGCSGLKFDATANGPALLASVFERTVELVPSTTATYRVADAGFPFGPGFYACIKRMSDRKWRRTPQPLTNTTFPSTTFSFGDFEAAKPANVEQGFDAPSGQLCGVNI